MKHAVRKAVSRSSSQIISGTLPDNDAMRRTSGANIAPAAKHPIVESGRLGEKQIMPVVKIT